MTIFNLKSSTGYTSTVLAKLKTSLCVGKTASKQEYETPAENKIICDFYNLLGLRTSRW